MNDTQLDELLNTWAAPAPSPSLRAGLLARLVPRRRPLFSLRWAAAFALAAATVAVGTSLVTDGIVGADIFRWDDHTYLRRTKVVHPFAAKLTLWRYMEGHSTGMSAKAGELTGSAYLVDRRTRVHYGYTWIAQPAGAGQYLFTVGPLDPAAVRDPGPIIPAPAIFPPKVVAAGSTFEVDLYDGPGGRVFDRYELAAQPMQMERHETPEQTAITLTLTDPKLWVNGQAAGDSAGVREVRGSALSVDVPGRGRFILVLDPRSDSRYVAAGTAWENRIEFTWAGDRYRVESSAPIATGGSRTLYIAKRDVEVRSVSFGAGAW